MKKLKFIPIGFYDYDNIIEDAIQDYGFEVTRFTPKGKYTPIQKLLNFFLHGKLLDTKVRRREEKYLLGDDTKYDCIFVINGTQLHADILEKYRAAQPQAKFILYLWDYVERLDNFESIRPYFDEIFSFDENDIETYGFKPLHNFYTDAHLYNGEKKSIMFAMSGLLHSGRIQVWDKIIRDNKIRQDKCYLYMLGYRIMDFVKAFLPGGDRWMTPKYIKVNPIPLASMAEVMKRSRVTLDVQYGVQRGLTFRTFDSMAAHTKLITTNEYIKNHTFYKYGNIFVIDKDNPVVPRSFFTEEFHEIPKNVMDEYSVTTWVKKIFG